MSSKHYLKINVYQAAQKRLNFVFSNFDNVLVAFSGGKDSGVLLNLTVQYALKNDCMSKLSMYFLDYEAQYKATMDYVKDVFDEFPGSKYWLALPNSVPSVTSMTSGHWIPWDKSKKDIWVRPMPSADYVISEDNVPWNYTPGTIDYSVQTDFNKWFAKKNGSTAVLIGIRADESLDRYRAIKSKNKVNAFAGRNYVTKVADGVYNAYPIYDWSVEDDWTVNARFGFSYNHLYDLLYQAGVPLNKMRVASPFLSQGIDSLYLYRVIEPDTWGKMLGRVNGANFASIYGRTNAMAWRDITLPKGYTWQSYVKFLLSTLPEDSRKDYERIFATSIKFWKERGGVLDDKTIDQLREAGVPVKIVGKTNYKTEKVAVTFNEYPDDVPVDKFKLVPSFKRMAITIMRNDHTAKYMGFSRTKAQNERRRKAIERYENIL
ncbi:DUF3440 domain-containing protein [Levilactobacillus andaensis]|uniref:DUF3440 domain-containing protein n=1 Tax=Levilactobacillus andaensis TaxID=2799570 RepID=UPI001940F0AD|nr:DUF3440 domain-containing protein [Levilactobacillus andaensis]